MSKISIEFELSGVEVKNTSIDKNGNFHIDIESTAKECKCHHCDKNIDEHHSYDREITIRHLPIFDKECYLYIKPHRFWCEDCNKASTEQFTWKDYKKKQTHDYEQYILKMLINSTISDVTRKENIDERTVSKILDKYYDNKVNWDDFEELGQIGIDEISLKKGHKDFVTIVTSRIDREITILGVLKDKLKDTVKKFLKEIPERLKKTVTSVCSDLYEGFINAAAEVFGKKMRIVADRFHVAKLYRNSFETLRKKEMNRLKQELNKEEYADLKNVMWMLRKVKNNLTCKERKTLKKLFSYSPELEKAYNLRNELTEILDVKTSRNGGIRRLKNWIAKVNESTVTCFKTFLGTLAKKMVVIANYFVERENSGFVEGFNNRIKVLKRRCYGITNRKYLFKRLSLDTDNSYFPTLIQGK
jgi:transposase